MDGDDSRLMPGERRSQAERALAEEYFALIRLRHAGGDFSERRFAGPVRAHQGQDFAAFDRQVDIVKRQGRAISLGDRAKRQGGAGAGGQGIHHSRAKSKVGPAGMRANPIGFTLFAARR